ncbi:MAG TPA: fused MFS/spermidine synthase [Candidatus Acidoferrales bacterium]
MGKAIKKEAAPKAFDASPYLPLLMILFAASGCAALVYEIVWYQMLQLVIGSTAISLGVLLATFMGGLCLGSLTLPRYFKRRQHHPLRVYAAIEVGIGICAILVRIFMPLVDWIYVSAVGHGMPAILLRAIMCAIILLPPTFLMGASLPAVARWIQTTPRGVSWLGLLYGANTAGAVFGCLLAGFYLLRVFDMASATYFAAGLNALIGFISYSVAKVTPDQSTEETSAAPTDPAKQSSLEIDLARPVATSNWNIYLTIALSGASALGAEVVWTRLLGLMLGATVYTFSIILAIFLVGLGIGSTIGSIVSRSVRARAALGYSQLLLAAAIAWTAFTLARSLPYWPINPLLSHDPWFTFQIDIVRVIWAIFPATLLWGASFPLALAAAATKDDDPGRLVGGIYAANTAGAIIGALAFSVILIPHIGTQNCERALITIAAVSAFVVLGPFVWQHRQKFGAALLIASMFGAGYLVAYTPQVPPGLIAYGRRFLINLDTTKILYVGEGLNSSIAISRYSDGAIQFHVSGKVEASTETYDMRLQRALGHLAGLVHPDPKSVLIVGFGAGVTAGSFVTYPSIQKIVICEMEPLVPPAATKYFGPQNYHVALDSRTTIVYDDARHYVLTTKNKFDIITSDPIHPWVKGSATLYSKEYFQMVKDHLNPGGVVTQWVPLYESDEATVKSEIATFFDVFPGGTVWANSIDGAGYDLFLLGQNGPTKIDVNQLQTRLDSPEYSRVAQSLRDVGFNSAVDLLSIYTGQDSELRPWLADATINTDSNLRLQYMAGMALNNSREDAIYRAILDYRRFPSNIITGSPERIDLLAREMQASTAPR